MEIIDTVTGEIIDFATAAYTFDMPGPATDTPTTVTPGVKHRTARRTGKTLTVISGLAPLLAGHINAIADLGDRLNTLVQLDGAQIVLSTQESDDWQATRLVSVRRRGRIRTSYRGTRHLPIAAVLDLGEQLYDQLIADDEPESS
ncbi:hypothetical protein [Streptomyces sp. NPDC087538]|uniref:hypothetical protein n=1 Tax=Streptomyces sp. NPDC087538 TaxID=3365797 RepID=UPI0038294759